MLSQVTLTRVLKSVVEELVLNRANRHGWASSAVLTVQTGILPAVKYKSKTAALDQY